MATYTQAQYQALVDAMATGALIVEHGGKKVQYRNQGDMQAMKREMEIDLGITPVTTRRKFARFSKGLHYIK